MHLSHYNALESISSSIHISQKLTILLTLLQSATFKGKPSAFSRIGIILAAYKLIQEIGCELEPALMAIGEIDAYVSCTQLFNRSKTSSNRYSFAQYNTTSSTPLLNAHNFWHPLLTNDTITLNSISLGLHDVTRNILLTGPNACGKSTNLKALTLCAYLAQTITIVPAEQYSQTLYKEIYSSIVVSDNIQKNKSLFVAELTHAEELLTRVENLQEGEFMLIALDELFKSTHHEKGQNVAYQLLQYLHQSPHVITLVSTHFEKLIELAHNDNNMCSNYTVDNFVLQPGIGIANNAFDIIDKKTKSRLLK
jgi:DNA mismatch repair ATPase MutS